jgi:outer membrane biosynthesis protein TonB
MTDTNAMELETTPDATAADSLQERITEVRARLEELGLGLAAVDEELESFASERLQHRLLAQACQSLEELGQAGGGDLFWNGLPGADAWPEHIARARARTEALHAKIEAIEVRRGELVARIGEQNEHLLFLEDEAFEHQEELERQRHEWIVDRELAAERVRPHLMLWMRDEEDKRSRKGLAIALCLWLLISIIVPFIKIPERIAPSAEALPERVVTVIPEAKKLEQAPPPPPELTRPVERKVERKPTPTRTETVKVEPQPLSKPQPTAKPQGILAFKDALTAVDDVPAVSQLGKSAKLSSSGINLASESRSFGGGGGERAAIQGTALTRASSGINAIAASADKASGGSSRRGGRSDEEIQVVFDRYKSALYRLYQRELRNDATLQGKVILRLTIEPDGSVSMAQVKSSEMEAPGLVADIVARVKGFNFGAKDVPAVTIVYPMNFLPAG